MHDNQITMEKEDPQNVTFRALLVLGVRTDSAFSFRTQFHHSLTAQRECRYCWTKLFLAIVMVLL